MGSIILFLIFIIFIVVIVASCIKIVPQAKAFVIEQLGAYKVTWGTGLHFKIPLIQEVQLVDTTIQGFPIGYRMDGEDSYQEPQYDENGELIDTNGVTVEEESLMITSDYNFVNVDFFVEYKISDPVKAVYASQDPVIILKNMSALTIAPIAT